MATLLLVFTGPCMVLENEADKQTTKAFFVRRQDGLTHAEFIRDSFVSLGGLVLQDLGHCLRVHPAHAAAELHPLCVDPLRLGTASLLIIACPSRTNNAIKRQTPPSSSHTRLSQQCTARR